MRLLTILAFLLVGGSCWSQTPPPVPQVAQAKQAETQKVERKPDLGIPDSYLIQFRNLQFQQDRLIIKLKNIEIAEKDAKVQEASVRQQIQGLSDDISRLAYQLATEKKLDPKKWLLDLDTLTWQKKDTEKKQ